jgi:hypothetical protein
MGCSPTHLTYSNHDSLDTTTVLGIRKYQRRRRGRWHGYGCASYACGDSYEGNYSNNQRHGRGVYRYKDGRVFEGMFIKDKKTGHVSHDFQKIWSEQE